jgi:hypothetical protein
LNLIDGFEELGDLLSRFISCYDLPNDRYAVCSCIFDVSCVVRCDTANANDGDVNSLCDVFQKICSFWGGGIGLALPGAVDGAASEIISTSSFEFFGCFGTAGRCPDDKAGRGNVASRLDWEIVWTQMNPVGIRGERNIQAVVDDKVPV